MAEKDWRAECDKLKGVVDQLQKDLKWERDWNDRRREEDKNVSNKFKDLLIDILSK